MQRQLKPDVCVTLPDPIGEVCGQQAAEACKTLPIPGCSVVCKVFDCTKPKEPKTLCPPRWRAATSSGFEGQCCRGPVDSAQTCCSPGRISPSEDRCCRSGEVVANNRCTKSGDIPPVVLCPPQQRTLLGECCFPPKVPDQLGVTCVFPSKPPGPKPDVPPSPPPGPGPCPSGPLPHPLVGLGHVGPAVSELQCKLTKANVPLLPLKVDKIFGPRTKGGVAAFQARQGLHVDGKVGPNTRKKLAEVTGLPLAISRTLVKGSLGKDVAELQTKLNGLGIQPLPLPTTERFTELEEGAVVGFQDRHSLQVDGRSGSKTWGALDAVTAAP